MRSFLDTLASVFAALFTAAVCAVPSWYTHVAIREGFASVWIYGAIAALCAIGLVLTIAFVRKATRGIAPSRQRKRR